ncbi:nudC domain-containing protein 3-like [Daphnia carinata]|uniref:nudC domain-containing protein 3-like n=1 Tax=Daphnia carinata TaxID=120202 RepID=UPI0025801336|nr:nudC domain-containing protein 3-like [Daphnia carinata]
MQSNKHDRLFLEILKEERSIVTFLDSVFGFLYRCTDFFQHQNDSSGKVGFPGGVAKDIVQKLFQRYENQTHYEKQAAVLGNMASNDSDVPSACQEVVLGIEADTPEPLIVETSNGALRKMEVNEEKNVREVYNGDDRGTYRWSQTLGDIDVFIPVTKDIQKAKQVNVKIDPLHLQVATVGQEGSCVLIDQTFPHRVIPDECLWSFDGEHVQVNLEKKEERWWDRLFSSDPPIDTKKIDTVIMTSDLSQEEHMKVEELIVNQGTRQQFSNACLEQPLEDKNFNHDPFS